MKPLLLEHLKRQQPREEIAVGKILLLLTRPQHNISRVLVASQVNALLFCSCQYYDSSAVVHNAVKDVVTR